MGVGVGGGVGMFLRGGVVSDGCVWVGLVGGVVEDGVGVTACTGWGVVCKLCPLGLFNCRLASPHL